MKRILIILLVLPFGVMAQYTETKTVERNYSVSGKGSLAITGKYGDIHIDTWDNKTVELKVKIEAKKRTASQAKEMVENVEIVINDSNKEALSFRTNINGSINNRSGEQLKIEYWVKAPKTLAYDLKNSYGNLYLDENSGENEINVAYGNLKIDECKGRTALDMSYSNGEIEGVSTGDLSVSYSNLSLGTMGSVELSSNYSNLDISDKTNELEVENRYGNVKMDEVNTLSGESKYGSVTIKKLYKSITFESLHGGGLKVGWISKDFDKIDLQSKYGSIELGFEKGFGATLDADMTYCSLRYGDIPLDYSHLREEAQHKVYKGVLGDGKNAGNRIISITSSYGNAKIDYAD
ncbi:MAG: hypothetical protein KDC79_07160 [Cyclobacteriaceae bacterium]|nr:hypothetical protein [Cyclobacteriaceae bacterium]